MPNGLGDPKSEAIPGMVIALMGMPGSGKSTAAKWLSLELDLDFLDLDDEICSRASRSVPELFADLGEEAFRALEFEVLKELLGRTRPKSAILALGGGTAVADERGVEVLRGSANTVYLWATPALLAEALNDSNEQAKRPLLQGSDLMSRVSQLYEQRHLRYLGLADYVLGPDLSWEELCGRLRELVVSILPGQSAPACDPMVRSQS